MKRQSSFGRGYVVLHELGLVGGKAVHYQMDRLGAAPHHLAQKFDEQLGVEAAPIGAMPEPPLRLTAEAALTDCRWPGRSTTGV
jgi:hypothetical protein